MANRIAPFGFRPVRYLNGASWNQQANLYYIPLGDGNAYYPGDAVLSGQGGDANGISTVVKATAGTETLRGVIVAVVVSPNPLNKDLRGTVIDNTIQSIPATKTRDYYVLVVDDPMVLFEIQDDGLNTPILTGTNAWQNKNAQFTVAAPTGISQQSASVLKTSTIDVTQGLNLKIHGSVQADDNDPSLINARWLVQINQHELMGNTAGV